MYFFELLITFLISIFHLSEPIENHEFMSLISSSDDDFCITNSSSAMYYTTSDGTLKVEATSFIPGITYFCDFENDANRNCMDSFKVGVWTRAYSIYYESTPLLDLRWESLVSQELPFKINDHRLSFLTLLKLKGLEDFKLPISLVGPEAHLFLCDREDVENANCYWFILQGWAQEHTVMRKCKSGQIKGLYPKGSCATRTVEKNHPSDFPLYLNEKKWSHVILERNKKTLYLKLYNESREDIIINYPETGDEMFDLNFLIGHRKDVKTYCKVHENFYMRSTSASEVIFEKGFSRSKNNGYCISILLNTCPYCSTTVIFLDETKTTVMFEWPIRPTNGIWEHHKIILNASSSQFMFVKLKTISSKGSTGNEFWSFDNIRDCYSEEYRITHKDQRKKFSECRLLENDRTVKKIEPVNDFVPDISCPSSSSIGSSCISCNILEQGQRINEKCKEITICEGKNGVDICYCSPGYMGSQCEKVCPEGTFGYSCKQQCGFCYPKGKCNAVDGSCVCNFLFEGPTCQMPKEGQYLKNSPRVIGSKADSCEIQWDSQNYIGKTQPKYYQIQYSDLSVRSVSWNDYEGVKMLVKDDKALIGKLHSSKKYAIRVLIGDEADKIKKLKSASLPSTICNTTCNGWNNDDIIIKPTSDAVNIHLDLTEEKCQVALYKYILKDKHGAILLEGKADINLPIPKLDPFENYSIIFSSGYQNITKSFNTLEGVPSEVKDIKLKDSTASSMKIQWEKPDFPNGNIEKYKVAFKKVRRIACENIWSKYSERNTTKNSIILEELESYSEYQVEIYALNRLNQGKGSDGFFRTKGIDHFESSEDLEKVLITNKTDRKSASLTFQNIQCEKLLGPLKFSVKFRCISEWCLKTEERSESLSSFQGTLVLNALQPYCKYKSDIFACRTNCTKHDERTFETKASVPNKLKEIIVIATGDAFMLIRWLPPYPPTGNIFKYKITTHCSNCRFNHENTEESFPKKCSIWPDYYCHQIDNYLYYGYEHSLTMQAANKENYEYVKIGYANNILIQEKESERPYNLFVIWNSDNTMKLFWNHPNRTNGILQYFTIQMTAYNGVFFKEYRPPKFNLTYNYTVTKIPTAVDLEIEIIAFNNKFKGLPAVIKDSSYPSRPDLENPQIYIMNYTKTTISISLSVTQKEVIFNSKNVGQYLFILTDDHSSSMKDPNVEKLEKIMNSKFESRDRVVAELDLRRLQSNNLNFTIGRGDVTKNNTILNASTINKPLQEAQYYNVIIIILNEYREKYRHTIYNVSTLTQGNPQMTPPPPPETRSEEEDSSGGNAAYALLLLLLLIPIIVVVIMKRRNIVFIRPTLSLEKIMNSTSRNSPTKKDDDETIPRDLKETVLLAEKPVMKVKPKLSIRKSTNPPNSSSDLYSKPVKMADFEEYVRESIESGDLQRQHELFPRGQTQPWNYGSNKVNKPKNRYNNLVAYDHSRVILEKIDGDEYSDYINANYIHGYNMERAYIATQGPKSTTLCDFWRMIWQENVEYIVMLANIYEGGKKKVEQYWPNINEELFFQDIVVQYQSMELFANFEYRIFHATKGDETRKIEQLHFTTWPDHGVPLYPQSLVPFLRKILKIPLSSTSPVVVHCSAGVGRTGTILLADTSLRMAAKQGVVDMLNNLQMLREQRPNMVDNIEQYKLAHLVVLECLMGLRTSIPCDEDMDKSVQKLIRDRDYKIQINYMKETEWQDQAMKSVAEFNEELPNYPEKNRIQEIFPENQGRIFLSRSPQDDESSSYINAVQVDAFRCPGRFIITQQPMPNTVGDFWRLVTERKIKVILSLNEVDLRQKTCCKFWPTADEPELQPVDFLLVKFGDVTELEYYDIFSLYVWIKSKGQKEKLEVKIVAFKGWHSKSMLPSSCEELLSFYEEADAISRGSTNVIVTCFDGVTASGVYVALSFIIEQMKLEHECDVCLAVRTIRHNRKQFVTDENQFLFLYESAVKYINGFQSYANFQNHL